MIYEKSQLIFPAHDCEDEGVDWMYHIMAHCHDHYNLLKAEHFAVFLVFFRHFTSVEKRCQRAWYAGRFGLNPKTSACTKIKQILLFSFELVY